MTIHVDRDNAGELLGQRTYLRVFAACDPTARLAEGEFVGYNAAPTVVLRQADGTLSAWQTTLPMEEVAAPQPAGPPPTEQAPPDESRRARILAMSPDARAALAEVMRQQRDKAAAEIARLQAEQQQITKWLAEFAPDASATSEGA